MKYYTVIKDHLIVFLICLVSLSTIVGWLLLASFVRHELIALETSARQANTDLEKQLSGSMEVLRNLNLDKAELRQRREVHLRQGKLSRASAVGYFSRRLAPSTAATVDIRRTKHSDAVFVPASSQFPSGSTLERDSYSPGSDNGPEPPTSYSVLPPEYPVPVDEDESVAECKCSLTSSCPAGPAGSIGLPGVPGEGGEPGFPGADGKDFDDIMEPTPLLNFCVSCPQGERGPPGKAGRRGRRGLRGSSGVPGIPGRNGNPGSPGEMGTEGVPGQDGDIGPMGTSGMDGITGQGRRGSKGVLGAEGSPGLPGDDGDHGIDGDMGPEGELGGQGGAGLPGADGEQGTVGLDGEPGHDAAYCPCPRQLYHYSNPVNRIL